MGIDTTLYNYPKGECNPEYSCYGDEFCNNIQQMNICNVKSTKNYTPNTCKTFFESPAGEEGDECCQSMYEKPWFYDQKAYSQHPDDFDKYIISSATQGSCENDLVCRNITSPGDEMQPVGKQTGTCMKPESDWLKPSP